MKKILVVGEGRDIEAIVREAANTAYLVWWVTDLKDAMNIVKNGGVFDAVVIADRSNGLLRADAMALDIGMAAPNLPAMIAIRADAIGEEIVARLRVEFENIDEVIPELSIGALEMAFERIGARRRG